MFTEELRIDELLVIKGGNEPDEDPPETGESGEEDPG